MPRYFSSIKSSVRQIFNFAKAPFLADALVQKFRERLGQPVGQRLGHDGIVIVVAGFEFLDEFFQSVPAGDRKCANDNPREFEISKFEIRDVDRGAMKSARHQFGVPSPFSICWRRKWNVVKTFARDSSV